MVQPCRKLEQTLDSAFSPAQERFCLCSSTEFASVFLHADTTNNKFTFLEKFFYLFGEKYLAKYQFKK